MIQQFLGHMTLGHLSQRNKNHFSSVQSLTRVRLFATPWIAARQASLSITNSRSSVKLTSIKSMMPSSHLILCHPLLLLPSIPPSIRVFSNESTLRMRWPKYWSFSFSIIPSKEIPGLISFRMDWLDLFQSKGLSRVFSNTTDQKHQFGDRQWRRWRESWSAECGNREFCCHRPWAFQVTQPTSREWGQRARACMPILSSSGSNVVRPVQNGSLWRQLQEQSVLKKKKKKHQFFSAQPSSQSNSHIHTWPQEKP